MLCMVELVIIGSSKKASCSERKTKEICRRTKVMLNKGKDEQWYDGGSGVMKMEETMIDRPLQHRTMPQL